jgi:6-phosphofructokinase 1
MQPTLQGVRAVQTLLSSTPETSSKVIGIKENKIEEIDLMQAVADVSANIPGFKLTEQTQAVAAAIERKDFAAAMAMRDPEFNDVLQAFKYSSKLCKDEFVPENKRLNIGIIQ